MRSSGHYDRESGFALLMVIVGLLVVSILALGVVIVTKSGDERATYDLKMSQMRAFFDGAILQIGVALMSTDNPSRPRIDGVSQTTVVLGQEVHLSVTSEFGKVDLNAADADTLSGLFRAAGEGPADANEGAQQIIDWRSAGTGADSPRLFRTTSEVTQVADITPSLYNRVMPAVTVYSGRGRIDESTAPLLALEAVPGMDRLAALSIIHDRATNRSNGSSTGEVRNGQLASGIAITGWAFTIVANFSKQDCNENGTAVIRMTGDVTRPYLVLWREERVFCGGS